LAVWKNKNLIVGEDHPNWKNGENAYREIMIRSGIPAVCKHCGTKDFRVLLVHHIDEDRKNNHIENLMWLCHNCHFLKHVHNIEA
jgi:5-methylcytosine-specific restriction endonuclease McrA